MFDPFTAATDRLLEGRVSDKAREYAEKEYAAMRPGRSITLMLAKAYDAGAESNQREIDRLREELAWYKHKYDPSPYPPVFDNTVDDNLNSAG